MKAKKPVVVSDFYHKMLDHKKAHDTGLATMARIDIIWRKSLAPFWKNIKPKDINQELITKFINWHKEKRPGIQLVNVFKYLGNIFAVMVESGAMDIARRPKLELPMAEQKHHMEQKGRYITDEEFQAILMHSEGWFHLFLLIAYTTGMRKMEIGKLEISRLKKVGDRYVAHLATSDTKTGRARQIPFAKYLTTFIDEQVKSGSRYLFPAGDPFKHIQPQAIDMKWKQAKKAAGIVGKMREHDLRHSAASNMAKSGISAVMATTILGMSLNTFQKTYLKLTADDLIGATESAVSRLGKK